MVKLLELNRCSQYLPIMNRICEEHIIQIDTSHEVDIMDLLKKMTFEIIIDIMFGKNCDKVIRRSNYIDYKTGEKSLLSFKEMYIKTAQNAFACFIDIKGRLLPFLTRNRLIEPFKSITLNAQELYDSISDSLDRIQDEDSIIYKMVHSGEASRDETIMDVLLLIFGSNDTSSTLLHNALLLLHKNPEKLQKLRSELTKSGYDKIEEMNQTEIKNVIMNCDYLSYVIKETLRMDPPGPNSLVYEAIEEFSVLGVHIPKSTLVGINSLFVHYDPEEYHKPLEFIPERFDADSEYFTKPSDGKPRHPKSHSGFMFGQRACTGQVLAKFESRVLLAKLVTRLEINHSESDLTNRKKMTSVFDNPCDKCTIKLIKLLKVKRSL